MLCDSMFFKDKMKHAVNPLELALWSQKFPKKTRIFFVMVAHGELSLSYLCLFNVFRIIIVSLILPVHALFFRNITFVLLYVWFVVQAIRRTSKIHKSNNSYIHNKSKHTKNINNLNIVFSKQRFRTGQELATEKNIDKLKVAVIPYDLQIITTGLIDLDSILDLDRSTIGKSKNEKLLL